ncbi:efflux RND transporter periplasmic adaptor subunit [Celeribacter sp. HF31]|uniref:efflux RND transporter periplasmic adaptor subunit n=1 Tax=Celeribacter sp. HF31 TaxID=2721558 RepID=UPI0014305E55|nr:efflux RND transporter periplasmic adaptor subunit [Celeribacter sp. HF31]NIY80999.1 efflux RND transporter periplasmic adaptor subunit [Celeribacter sp. HF31]
MTPRKTVGKTIGWLALALLPASAFAETPVPVEVITAQSHPIEQELRLVGSVEASDSFPASFRRGGQIDVFNAETGMHFKAGEVIARIDPTNIVAELDAAKANLDAAEAALVQADQARSRAQSLLDRGVGTQAQYDEAQQSYLAAKATRDQAAALLETAEQARDDTVLRAARDVIVTDRFVDLGEVVSAGKAVVQLAPEGELQAIFFAPDAAGLSRMRGREVELDPNGPLPPFTASVTEVLPVLTNTGTVEIRADIPLDQTGDIPIGTSISGRAAVMTDTRIVLPWTALSANAEGPAVWLVDPETFTVSLTPVTIAGYDDTQIELSEGLKDGDLVVGAGSHLLYDGRTIQTMEATQ